MTKIGLSDDANLTRTEIPNSVTTIGKLAFSSCVNLTSAEIPNSVTTIGKNAFFECDNLTLIVGRDSYARQYAIDNNIPYTYSNTDGRPEK